MLTLPTGAADTDTLTVPALPSLVAVTVVLPTPVALMSPDCDTVATAVLPLDHVTARPVSALPCASRGVAVICCVPPTVSDVLVGETLTVATGAGGGAVTVTAAVAVFPSLVAVIVALPGATAVTTPLGATVATFVLLELHVTTRPVSTLFDASRVVAVSVPVAPVCRARVVGATEMVATGAGGGAVTVTLAAALLPSLVAVIVAGPGAAPVTTPACDTVATPGLLELQAMALPVRTLFAASRAVAVSVPL